MLDLDLDFWMELTSVLISLKMSFDLGVVLTTSYLGLMNLSVVGGLVGGLLILVANPPISFGGT